MTVTIMAAAVINYGFYGSHGIIGLYSNPLSVRC